LNDGDPAVRAEAAQAIGTLHGSSLQAQLTEALKDPDTLVRVSAARSLAQFGDRAGFQVALASAKNDNKAVRVLAIETLGWVRDPIAIPLLQSFELEPDGTIHKTAEAALKRIREKKK
jgi:HEAT repeat protein